MVRLSGAVSVSFLVAFNGERDAVHPHTVQGPCQAEWRWLDATVVVGKS